MIAKIVARVGGRIVGAAICAKAGSVFGPVGAFAGGVVGEKIGGLAAERLAEFLMGEMHRRGLTVREIESAIFGR